MPQLVAGQYTVCDRWLNKVIGASQFLPQWGRNVGEEEFPFNWGMVCSQYSWGCFHSLFQMYIVISNFATYFKIVC